MASLLHRHLRACAAPRKLASRKKNRTEQGEGVFVSRSLTRITPRETDLRYDELASGATIYAYVGNDPLSYIDPLGMTRADIELMTDLVRTNEPELQVPNGPVVYFQDVNLSGNQYTTVHQEGTYEEEGDSMSLSDKYLGQLSEKELLDLYDTIAHESLHKTCGPDSAKPAEHYYITQEAHRMTTAATPLIQDYFGYGH